MKTFFTGAVLNIIRSVLKQLWSLDFLPDAQIMVVPKKILQYICFFLCTAGENSFCACATNPI